MRTIKAAVVALVFCISHLAAEEPFRPGLMGEYFQMAFDVSDFPVIPADKKPTLKRVDPQIAFEFVKGTFHGTGMLDRFYVRWSGTITISTPGIYTFFTESDDGSRVSINGVNVVDNRGLHAMQEEEGEIEMSAGSHRIKLEYIQFDGGGGCILSWKKPGGEKQIIPADVFHHAIKEESADVLTAVASDAPVQLAHISEPPADAKIEEKVKSILPRPEEEPYAGIAWRRNLNQAREDSQLAGKPLFLWIMNGNPLGCT